MARSRVRNLAANLLLLTVTLVVTYVVAGALFLRFGPPLMPGLINVFPVAANVWWQASAPDPAHQDYIAIAGDSYAAGYGDWRAARSRSDQPFHAGDILGARLGKPVLAIGQAGAGSAEGLVLFPARVLDADRCLIFGKPRVPRQIVVLFYEGNDLNDNLGYIRKVLQTRLDDPKLGERIARHLGNDYGDAGLGTCLGYFASSLRSMWRILVRDPDEVRGAGEPNQVTIGGKTLAIPPHLQGPALELSEQEMAIALTVTSRGLDWLHRALPQTAVSIVLVPSVLSSYRLAGESVTMQTYQNGERIQPARRVAEASDRICVLLRAVAQRGGASFIDARPALRRASRDQIVHGPRDWAHFNQAGYTALGDAIADVMTGTSSGGECARLAASD